METLFKYGTEGRIWYFSTVILFLGCCSTDFHFYHDHRMKCILCCQTYHTPFGEKWVLGFVFPEL